MHDLYFLLVCPGVWRLWSRWRLPSTVSAGVCLHARHKRLRQGRVPSHIRV